MGPFGSSRGVCGRRRNPAHVAASAEAEHKSPFFRDEPLMAPAGLWSCGRKALAVTRKQKTEMASRRGLLDDGRTLKRKTYISKRADYGGDTLAKEQR